MKISKMLLLSVLSITFSAVTHGAVTTAQGVTSIAIVGSGSAIIKLDGTSINPAACTNAGYQILDEAQRKEWIATLLTAKASGAQVKLNISEGACNANNNPQITAVTLL